MRACVCVCHVGLDIYLAIIHSISFPGPCEYHLLSYLPLLLLPSILPFFVLFYSYPVLKFNSFHLHYFYYSILNYYQLSSTQKLVDEIRKVADRESLMYQCISFHTSLHFHLMTTIPSHVYSSFILHKDSTNLNVCTFSFGLYCLPHCTFPRSPISVM